MTHLVLVDGNNLGFAAMANPKLSAGERETHAIFGAIKSIRKLYIDYPEALIMVLWDGRSWRHECAKTFGAAEYKANREQTESQREARQAYFRQKDDITLALKLLGVPQAKADNMEADDLAEIYSRKWQGDKVTLISGDKDWLQLIDHRTIWVDPIMDRQCTHQNFTAFTGTTDPKQFVEQKCILGDAGDNIKGLKGVGPKTLEKIYMYWDEVMDFFNDEQRKEKWEEYFDKSMPAALDIPIDDVIHILSVNESLMNLRTVSRPEPINLMRVKGALDEKGFLQLCNRNAFLSFTRNYDHFLKPFKGNKFVQTHV